MSEISSKGVSLSLTIIHSSNGMCSTTSSEIKLKLLNEKHKLSATIFQYLILFW